MDIFVNLASDSASPTYLNIMPCCWGAEFQKLMWQKGFFSFEQINMCKWTRGTYNWMSRNELKIRSLLVSVRDLRLCSLANLVTWINKHSSSTILSFCVMFVNFNRYWYAWMLKMTLNGGALYLLIALKIQMQNIIIVSYSLCI